MKKTIAESSGNVFADLGYAPDEAAILQMRADLMADLRKFNQPPRSKLSRYEMNVIISQQAAEN